MCWQNERWKTLPWYTVLQALLLEERRVPKGAKPNLDALHVCAEHILPGTLMSTAFPNVLTVSRHLHYLSP